MPMTDSGPGPASRGTRIHGQTTDSQTRCVHYNTALDIIAIKFACCLRFYPCFRCHEDGEDHPAEQWPVSRWSEEAILCGVCRSSLSITGYLGSTRCPSCAAGFNPRCAQHAHLYFQVPDSADQKECSGPGKVPPRTSSP